MSSGYLVALIAIYVISGRFAVLNLRGRTRDIVFSFLNVAALYGFFFYGRPKRFCIYLAIVAALYLVLVLCGKKRGFWPWLAFFAPIAVLVVFRYFVPLAGSWLTTLLGAPIHLPVDSSLYLIGISYLAFRSSHLVLEVRNEIVPMPSIWQYFGFCFFAPTMTVGPINAYSNHLRAFGASSDRIEIPVGRSLIRLLVGLVKVQFLGNYFNQLGFDGLLLDDHFHHSVDLPIACVFYYLYLYCNFSGYCDAAIGAAGLIGVPVSENFKNPLAARNMKDFWNRWHITLSSYMRDVLFSPLSKYLGRTFGPANINHAIAVTIAVIFILIGIWHGLGWNFVAFGAVHSLGVVTNHYYTINLKKRLGRERFKAYNENRLIHAAAVVVTFTYCAGSMFFFANTFPEMGDILRSLR